MLEILIFSFASTLWGALIDLPCLIIACTLAFELKRVRSTLIVFDKTTCGNWTTKFRDIFCWIEARLLFQVHIYWVLVLAISSVLLICIFRGDGASIIDSNFLLLEVLGHWAVLYIQIWSSPCRLLLHFTTIMDRRQYFGVHVTMRSCWNALDLLNISNYERSRVLLWRCSGIICGVIATNR